MTPENVVVAGDCLDVMPTLDAASVDAIVCDPPYDLTSTGARKGSPRNPGTGPYSRGFMGKAWDGTGVAFRPETWAECLRVARPSSYLLAFGGTRTVHRMTTAIEDAGWIIRDMLVWAYASGFPKSKASLKPAWEPIVMARKPGPLRMLAIDACRIPMSADDAANIDSKHAGMDVAEYDRPSGTSLHLSTDPMPLQAAHAHEQGRWPANVLLTDPIFDGGIEGVVGGGITESGKMQPTIVAPSDRTIFGQDGPSGYTTIETYGDAGTYSRFFLIPKADRTDREPVLRTDREPVLRTDRELPFDDFNRNVGNEVAKRRENSHPTVKPVDLMRHLVRLVTPADGLVLDPFLGSGTTALACELEGFRWLGIEREPEYIAIAEARLNGTQRGLGLVG